VNDRVLVEVIHGCHDAVLEFLFGCDADMAQDGARELGEEAFDQVQPGAVLGRRAMHRREAHKDATVGVASAVLIRP